MEKAEFLLQPTIKIILSFVASIPFLLWGGWNIQLTALSVLIVFDFILGIGRASYQHELNSRRLNRGIWKKLGFLMGVSVAHQCDLAFGLNNTLMTMALSGFVVGEAVSILENLNSVGVKLPPQIMAFLKDKQND